MTTKVTVESMLNAKALRADWPKMSAYSFEAAVRLAAYVGRAMQSEPEDENAKCQKQYFLSFVALRRALPRNIMMNLVVVGPKLSDFMDVITEVSGLAVVQTNRGLWFFDMRGRVARNGGYPHSEFAKHYATVLPETAISQFKEDEDEDGDC